MQDEGKKRKKDDGRREFAATVLFEAAFATDAEVAARYGIAVRSVERYRRALGEDVRLAGLVALKRRAFERASPRLPAALLEAVDTLEQLARSLRAGQGVDPKALERLAHTFRTAAGVLPAGVLPAGRAPDFSTAWGKRGARPVLEKL